VCLVLFVGVRAKDWSRTPLGPIENWPTCLTVALDIALPSQFPIVLPCTPMPPICFVLSFVSSLTTIRLRYCFHLTQPIFARAAHCNLSLLQVIFWGPEYRMLYNDAYRPIFGREKHPGYIGSLPFLVAISPCGATPDVVAECAFLFRLSITRAQPQASPMGTAGQRHGRLRNANWTTCGYRVRHWCTDSYTPLNRNGYLEVPTNTLPGVTPAHIR
jgi:hypothetical protein